MKNPGVLLGLAAAMMAGKTPFGLGDGPREFRSGNMIIGPQDTSVRSRKCLLPECGTFTTHNGGYCCAEHCKQDKSRK